MTEWPQVSKLAGDLMCFEILLTRCMSTPTTARSFFRFICVIEACRMKMSSRIWIILSSWSEIACTSGLLVIALLLLDVFRDTANFMDVASDDFSNLELRHVRVDQCDDQ
jgi:hypothetical protein